MAFSPLVDYGDVSGDIAIPDGEGLIAISGEEVLLRGNAWISSSTAISIPVGERFYRRTGRIWSERPGSSFPAMTRRFRRRIAFMEAQRGASTTPTRRQRAVT